MKQQKKRSERERRFLGIEFGSTRIKAVLVDESHAPIAMGTYDWENRLKTIFGPIAWRTSGKDCRDVTRAWQTMWRQNTVKS